MKRLLFALVVVLVVSSTRLIASDAPLLVAIIPFEAVHIDGQRLDAAQPAAKAMEDLLQSQVSDAEQITLVERARIDQVLKEQSLALSGLVDPATAARVGQLLKADVVVVGRVRPLDGTKRLATVRAVAVADTRVLWSAEAQGDDGALAGQAVSLGAALSTALRNASGQPAAPVGATPLRAVKHHERAAALRALGAAEEAATEELLALRHDPGLADAEMGFLTALAAAGFEGLAGAEAQAAVERVGPAAPKALIDLAARTAMPVPSLLAQREDSLETVNIRRFVDLLERRARSAPAAEATAARKDVLRAWILLGDAYVGEHRDRKASEAYREAVKRAWDLRANDPAVMFDPDFFFERICDSLAAKAIEQSAYGRYFSSGLKSTLRAAVARGDKLPDGVKPPLVVYAAELPIADRVLLPKSDRAWSLLLRVKPGVLPAQARLTRCRLEGLAHRAGWQNANDNFQGGLLDTHWVGSEATGVLARTGVAWPTAEAFGNDAVFGRQVFNGAAKPYQLLAILDECCRRGEHDCGFVVREAMGKPVALPEVHIHVEFVLPPGTPATGFAPSRRSRLAQGVYLLLVGRGDEARREFQELEQATEDQEAIDIRSNASEFLALCGAQP